MPRYYRHCHLNKVLYIYFDKIIAIFIIYIMVHLGKHLISYWPLIYTFWPVFDIQIGNSLILHLSNVMTFGPRSRKKLRKFCAVLKNCVLLRIMFSHRFCHVRMAYIYTLYIEQSVNLGLYGMVLILHVIIG